MDTERTQFTLSQDISDILDFWAWLHGRQRGAFAGHLVSARVAANTEEIQRLADLVAEMRGVSVDVLKDEWKRERAGTPQE